MRAAVMAEAGSQRKVDDLEIEGPGADEVLVRVHWCSACHSDLHALDGVTPPPLPTVLGHETAGVVEAIGSAVDDLAPGDHVVLSMVGPCGACSECVRGAPMTCLRSGGFGGVMADGSTRLTWRGERVWRALRVAGFAEYAVVPQRAAVRLPTDLPLDLASILGCSVQTGWGAVVNIAQAQPGSTMVVVGLGAVGIAAVQSARISGVAAVVGVDPNPWRRELAEKLGASASVGSIDEVADAIEAQTGARFVDFVIDTVSNPATVRGGMALLRPKGTMVVVGVRPPGETLGVDVTELVITQKRILGCFLGDCVPRRDIPKVVELWRQGRFDLEAMVTGRRDFADLDEAFDDLREGRGLRTAVKFSDTA